MPERVETLSVAERRMRESRIIINKPFLLPLARQRDELSYIMLQETKSNIVH